MSSPNEPGYPRAGDAPGGANGSPGPGHDGGALGNAASRPGPLADSATCRPGSVVRRPGRPAHRDVSRRTRGAWRRRAATLPAGHPPGVDARLNRFMSGGSGAPAPAPAREQDAPPRRAHRDGAARGLRQRAARPVRAAPALATAAQARAGPRLRPNRRVRPAATSRVQVGTRHKGPVRASMQIRRIDPWSALKVSLVLSVALFFVWMIAVAFLYLVLGGHGRVEQAEQQCRRPAHQRRRQTGGELVSSGTIFGGAALIGLVNIVLLTAMGDVWRLHLQPDHRPGRWHRSHPGRSGLDSVWAAAYDCGNLVARPCGNTGL